MKTSRTALAAILVAASLALSACSGVTGSWSDLVTWTDGEDGVPVLTVASEVRVATPDALLIADGDGDAIEVGQTLLLDYVVIEGATGEELYATYGGTGAEPVVFDDVNFMPTLVEALTGAHVGATILFAVPDETLEVGLDGTFATQVFAMTVSGILNVLDRAEGTAVEPVAGLPVVTLDDNGAPSINVEGLEQPTALVIQPLIEGAGEPVAVGSQITVHYSGWLWDGTSFDSSWDRGEPASFGLVYGQLIDGWVVGLEGQSVGSQVLLVLPPEYGYGDAEGGAIPPNSTLVFVVDILASN